MVVGKTVNLHKFCLYGFTYRAFQRQRELYICTVFDWLFVFWLYVSVENFSLIWRIHHYWWMSSNLDLIYSALVVIEHWGFFSMPHLLLHGSSIYNDHFLGPVALTPVVGPWQWSCHCIYELGLSWLRFELIVFDFDFRHNKQYNIFGYRFVFFGIYQIL